MKNLDGKVELTEDVKIRICNYQRAANNGKGFSDVYVARELGHLLDERSYSDPGDTPRTNRYKNIKNKDTKRYITEELADKLAELFGCTTDELIYGKTHNENGIKLNRAFKAVDAQKKAKLYEVLDKDPDSIDKLHFLYCELPAEDSFQVKQALLSLIEQLSDNSYYSTSIKSMEQRTKLISKLLKNDKFFSDSYIVLLSAEDDLQAGQREKALAKYLQIVIDYTTNTVEDISVWKEVILRIHSLEKYWSKFPSDVSMALKELLPTKPEEYTTAKVESLNKNLNTLQNYIFLNH